MKLTQIPIPWRFKATKGLELFIFMKTSASKINNFRVDSCFPPFYKESEFDFCSFILGEVINKKCCYILTVCFQVENTLFFRAH